MQIEERGPATLYRLIVSGLAGYGVWLECSKLGWDAWRLFSSWFLILAAIYYLVSACVSFFRRRKPASHITCPMLQGMLVVAGMTLLTGQIVFYALDFPRPGLSGLGASLVYYILPVLVLLDWIIFSEKGRWRAVEPLYWLSLPTVFACGVLTTAAMMPASAHLRYPYEFLDWTEIGIDGMLWQLAVIALLVLIFGYLCWLIDFTMSGHLAQTIILPRIKTIIIEDDEEVIDNNQASVASEPEEKPEIIEVIEPKIKINVEGIKDQKAAGKVHKAGAEIAKSQKEDTGKDVAKEPKGTKNKASTTKSDTKEIKIVIKEEPKKPESKPPTAKKSAESKQEEAKDKTTKPKVRIVEQMADIEAEKKARDAKVDESAEQSQSSSRSENKKNDSRSDKANQKSSTSSQKS